MIRTTFTAIIIALTATVAQAEMYGDWVFHEVKDEMTGENNVWLWQ